jgi:hypothetical protein
VISGPRPNPANGISASGETLADAYHDLSEGKTEEAKRKLRAILSELDTA